MSILHQANKIAQAVISNGLVTGNEVQNPDNLLNTTDETAIFGATSDVIIGNFPFSLPLDAVIVGIAGILKARVDSNSVPPGSITPVLVDASSGSNQYYPGAAVSALSNVLEEYDIGGAFDIWGNITWTPTKINNLKLQLIGNTALEVAWASLTVYYYIPVTTPTPSPFDLPGCEDCDSTIQALPFELARTWLSGDTSLLLKSFSLPNGTPITLEMLGECGGTINLTIDPDLRREDGSNFIENFNLDADIASITIVAGGVELELGNINQRGLDFVTPYGHDAGNISEHAVGAVVIISNNGPWNGKLLKRCHVGTLVSAPIEVQDEGSPVVVALEKLNFIGPNVQAEMDSGNPRKANVTVIGNPTNVDPTEENTNTGTNNTTPSLTVTVPLTVTSANYMRVKVFTEDEVISSVTYNGVPMTLVPLAVQVNPGVNLKVAIYELINPTVGAHNVVVTMATPRIITAVATGWLDVDTSNPVDGVSAGNIGSDDAPTDSATTTTENTVMEDAVGTTNNPTTFTQSGLWAINGAVTTGIRPGASASRRVLSPQLVTSTYGLSVSTGWAMVMAGIRGIVAPTPGTSVQSVTDDANTVVVVDNTDPQNPIVQFFAVVLANLAAFYNALIANVAFITGLTSNATFQTLVNAFVGGGGGGGNFDYEKVTGVTASTNAGNPGNGDSPQLITVTTTVAKRFLLSFQGQMTFQNNNDFITADLSYNVDAGTTLIPCSSASQTINDDVYLPIGAAVYTDLLPPGTHTFRMNIAVICSDANTTASAIGTLYAIGLTPGGGEGSNVIESISGETISGATVPVACFLGTGATITELANPNATSGPSNEFDLPNSGVASQITFSEESDISHVKVTWQKIGANVFTGEIRIYSDVAGAPGVVLGAAPFTDGDIGNPYGEVTLALSTQIHLAPGTYWLGLVMLTGFTGAGTSLGGDNTGIATRVVTVNNGGAWTPASNNFPLSIGMYLTTIAGRLYVSDAGMAGRNTFDALVSTTQVFNVATEGIVSGNVGGFVGLTFPALYYVQDAHGTIGTTPGSVSLKVGKSFSATNLIGYPRT